MKRRIISIITALVLCLGLLPGTALAADTNPVLDISNGSIWIKDGQYAQAKSVTAPAVWTDYTGEITITGTSASWYSVTVSSGTHTIRLKDAAIKPQANQDDMRVGTPALSISGSTVNLILEGTSTLKGSGSYALETLGKDCVNLSASNLSITGGGTLNIQGGDSLRQAEASSPIGGNGFILSGSSTLRVSDGAVLNVTGGNMSLGNNWWGVGIYAENSSIELSGGALSSKGVEGFDLRNSRLSQSGGTLSVEGRRGIDSEENQKFQAEISSGSANIHSYIYSALRCGSLTVSGGEVTLRTDSSLGAVESTASVTVSPASGYAGILKNGDGPDSAVRTPIPEEKTLSSIQEKYVNLTFSNETHVLTVQDGGAGSSGSGSYLPGQKVSIRAGTVADKDFKWWEKVSGDGVFANAEAADTTFTMGWEDAEIRPVFVTGKVVGDFAVSTEDESGYTYESGVLTISGSGTYAISMKEPGTATGNRIRLNGGNPTVILDGVQINSGESAITLDPSSTTNATLMLSGVNKLSATGLNAGIAVWTSNPTYYSVSLTITSLAGDGSSEGRLETTGYSGIGAYGSQDSGAITINGGTVIATGNGNGSYVGYGIGSKGSNPVTINGGDVTATGEQGFSNNLILNNNPSIQVDGQFKNGVSGDEKSVHIYYDSMGGSTVKSVAVTPQDGKVLTNETLQFAAQVEGGGNADKAVIWSVTGALSEGTSIDENGLLTVFATENAKALTVTASNSYSGLSGNATVTVTKPLLLPTPTGLQLSLPDKLSETNLDAVASWDAVDGADSYSVQLYKDGTTEGGEISVTGTSHHFSIHSQGKYTFKVKAVRSDAESPEAESNIKQICSVSFLSSSSQVSSLQLVVLGSKLERPEDPVKAGYNFTGWENTSNSTLWDFESDTVQSDVILAEVWKKIYAVTVETEGSGTASASPTSAVAGTNIILTATPDGDYYFKQWEVISGSVTVGENSFVMPEEDVTLKAVFEQETYTVTVQTDGNGTASVSSTSAAAGTSITLTATPDRGYYFKEWQIISGDVTVNENSFTMPKKDVTLKAVFELLLPAPTGLHLSLPDKASRNSLDATASWDAVDEAASYLVQLYKNGTAEGGEVSVTGTSHHFSIRSKGKYTFKIRAVRSDGAEGPEAESEAKQVHLVEFMLDGNVDTSLSQLSAEGGKLERPEDPVKAGYTFGGWKKGLFSTNLWDFENDTVKNTATLIALWKKNYTVTVQADGNGSASASPNSAAAGTAITLTATANSGYHFKEWEVVSGGVTISNGSFTMPEGDVTVKAVFEQGEAPPEPETYTITVQTEGNGTASAAPTSATEGTAITLTATANSGYHFKEWEVVSGSVTISNDSFIMPAGNVTVKAVFEQDAPETYTVTVQTEGSGRASASPASATAGTTISLTATADSGYHFKEWQVVSGGVTISGSSFTMPEGNVTVKAVFEQDAPPEHVHKWAAVWSGDGNHHWHECLADGCDITSDSGKIGYGAHVYDDEQDADCNVCGHIRTVTPPEPEHVHKWAAVWSGDGNHHWHECLADGCDITSDSGKDGYGAHVYDDEQDADCNVCGHVREVTPPEQPDDETTKIEIAEGIAEVPPALAELEHLNTPEKLAQAMRTAVAQTGVPSGNTAVYDVTLMISTDGGASWTKATAENFPANGLTVTLPYPVGTNSSYTFTVVHMFTTSDFGKTPGDTETPRVTNTASGLQFTVTGLSPISVGWVQPSTPTTPTGPTGGGGGGGGGSSSAYAVTVERAEHGKVTSDRTNASSGSTVTLTVTPDTGYVLDTLTVTDSRGNEIRLTAQGGGKYTFTMLSRAVTVKATFAPLPDDTEKPCDGGVDCPSHGFTDLGTVGTWYHEAVDYVLRNNLMGGYGNGLFGPNDTLTRAQFAQILYNKEGRPAVTGGGIFTDVAPGAWCAPAITWAAERGIVGGYGNGMFGPNDNITREQLAVMLWRYAGSPAATDKELHFNDADKASGYALDALRWAVENGIINGKGGGILDPKGLATRAQTAQILKNFLKDE